MSTREVAVIVPLACAVASWLVLAWLLRSGYASRFALDAPNHRSLHIQPVPRVGGLVMLVLALGAIAWLAPQLRSIAVLAAVLVFISAWDDRGGLPVLVRLGVQLVIASLASWHLLREAGLPALILATVLITWAMNLYNFMDGSDGLAGGMAAAGFGALGLAAWASAPWLASASLCLAAVAFGFLVHNFPPAKVFMGDAGSVPLGFLAAALGIRGSVAGTWPLWFPVLVFSPFIVDATFTLVHRVCRGERPWHAHREHLYQRLVRSGLGHLRTALAYYLLMLACAASGLWALSQSEDTQRFVLGSWALIYGILVAVTVRRYPLLRESAP